MAPPIVPQTQLNLIKMIRLNLFTMPIWLQMNMFLQWCWLFNWILLSWFFNLGLQCGHTSKKHSCNDPEMSKFDNLRPDCIWLCASENGALNAQCLAVCKHVLKEITFRIYITIDFQYALPLTIIVVNIIEVYTEVLCPRHLLCRCLSGCMALC